VLKAGAGYIVGSLGLLEASDILTSALHLPPPVVSATFWALLLGFPVAIVVAWRWDLTTDGYQVTDAAEPHALTREVKERSATSIAVLPFADLSQTQDQAYFCDGIADEIITALSYVDGLGVASRTSAFALREVEDVRAVGKELGVDAVLGGSVRKVDDHLRVSAELVEVDTGLQLWSEQYDRRMADVIQVQEDIAHAVVDKLRSALGPQATEPRMRSHSPDPEAYELYLQARHFWTRRHEVGLDKSIEYYLKAIAIDPGYALAHAGLADVYMFKGFYFIDEPGLAWARAREAIGKALAENPDLAEAHRANGMMQTWYAWRFEEADASFRRAIELNPSDPLSPVMYAQLLAATGRREEATAMAERGRRLDPTSAGTVGLTAVGHAINRDSSRAAELTESALTRDTVNFLSRYIAGTAYIGQRDYPKAIEHLEFAVELSRRNPLIVAFLAQAYGLNGQEQEARDVLESLDPVPEPLYPHAARAAAWATLGEMERVPEDMDRAIERREPILFISASAPVFDPLRKHELYAEWMSRIGLPLIEI
jgi:TolB-like protein/Tfp pilus assembly protein PilF